MYRDFKSNPRNGILINNIQYKKNTIPRIPYYFIHPTKVGGSAFITCFTKYYPNLILSKGHTMKCSECHFPIIILRDPLDRFLSMYKYWKYGAKDGEHQRTNDFINVMKNVSLKDYIQFVKSNNPILLTKFTSKEHYSPLTNWITPSDYSKTIIIIYDKKNMEQKVFDLIQYLNVYNFNISFPEKNVSKGNESLNELSEELIQEIKEMYKSDYELFDKIKNEPHLFKKII